MQDKVKTTGLPVTEQQDTKLSTSRGSWFQSTCCDCLTKQLTKVVFLKVHKNDVVKLPQSIKDLSVTEPTPST